MYCNNDPVNHWDLLGLANPYAPIGGSNAFKINTGKTPRLTPKAQAVADGVIEATGKTIITGVVVTGAVVAAPAWITGSTVFGVGVVIVSVAGTGYGGYKFGEAIPVFFDETASPEQLKAASEEATYGILMIVTLGSTKGSSLDIKLPGRKGVPTGVNAPDGIVFSNPTIDPSRGWGGLAAEQLASRNLADEVLGLHHVRNQRQAHGIYVLRDPELDNAIVYIGKGLRTV